jgi:hypothetical protein
LKKVTLLISSLLLSLLFGCESHNDAKHEPSISGPIKDNKAWFRDESQVVTSAVVTLSSSPSSSLCAPYTDTSAPLRPCTLEDVEHDTNAFDDYTPELSVIFSATGYTPSNELTNAILKQKGKSTRSAPQKSYKIKLDSDVHLYNSQRRLQYNKQIYDLTRIRNKLSFDLFQEIPNFGSLKTSFVQLTIDGEDKGLYTKVESYDKEYLINRGYNKDDNLYKAEEFWFSKTPALALKSDGTPVDSVAFGKLIDPVRGKKQTKLLEMLTAIENLDIDIDVTVDHYFNRDNYLTWLAVNIIVGNVDTTTQNYFLLNPLYSDTFYFLPWDYDGAWGWNLQVGQIGDNIYSQRVNGIARYWDSPLHKRFLSKKSNRDALDTKIEYLRDNYLTDSKIKEKIAAYKLLIKPYIFTNPDILHLPHGSSGLTIEVEWNNECDLLPDRIANNIVLYNKEKGKPMPFWQVFTYNDNVLRLSWDKSVDLEGDSVTYSLKLGKDLNLTSNLLINDKDLDKNSENVTLNDETFTYTFRPNIPFSSGDILYMKVLSKDSSGNTQESFDSVEKDNNYYHGTLKIVIP